MLYPLIWRVSLASRLRVYLERQKRAGRYKVIVIGCESEVKVGEV